jgi:hypothetical protein
LARSNYIRFLFPTILAQAFPLSIFHSAGNDPTANLTATIVTYQFSISLSISDHYPLNRDRV